MELINYKITNFEGPLDLLLHLVSKNRMKLYEIHLTELIDSYLEAVGSIGPEQLDEATEFVEMAARLVYLKSVLLLPRSEEADKLELELTGQLVEYSLCKQAAKKLGSMAEGVFHFVREPMKVAVVEESEYDVKHSATELVDAFESMSLKLSRRRPPDAKMLADSVAYVCVPVSTRIIHILKGLRAKTMRSVGDVFRSSHSTSEAVATFLALLELMRSGRVALDSEGDVRIIEKDEVINAY